MVIVKLTRCFIFSDQSTVSVLLDFSWWVQLTEACLASFCPQRLFPLASSRRGPRSLLGKGKVKSLMGRAHDLCPLLWINSSFVKGSFITVEPRAGRLPAPFHYAVLSLLVSLSNGYAEHSSLIRWLPHQLEACPPWCVYLREKLRIRMCKLWVCWDTEKDLS